MVISGPISKVSEETEQLLRWVSFRLGGWMIRWIRTTERFLEGVVWKLATY